MKALLRNSVFTALLFASFFAHAVLFRLPLAVNTSVHYYYDHDTSSGIYDWKCGSETYDGHRGTDFSGGPRGTPIYAAADGTLDYKIDGFGDGYVGSTDGAGFGNHVRLLHPGSLYTYYGHMTIGSVTTKTVGSAIACSEQIGGVGTSGSSSGLHLHFEPRTTGGTAIDPYSGSCNSPTSMWVNQGSGSPSTTCEGTGNHPPTLPGAPTVSPGTVTASGATITWGASTDADGNTITYELQYSIYNTPSDPWHSAGTTTSLTRSISGLAANTSYDVRVQASDGQGGVSAWNETAPAFTTTTGGAPAAPTANAATSITSSSFQANWSSSSGATGYYMDVSTSSTFSSYVYYNYDVGNYVGITVTPLSAGTTYYYRIRAYNGSGTSGNSGTITVTTTGGAPSAPTANAATSITSSSFQANWNASNGATGYYMDVSTSSTFSSYVYYNYDVGNYLGITVTPLSAGTTYYYRIRAYNGSGTSGNSGTITVTTTGIAPSAPTANVATSITSSSFQANWSSSSGATGYRIDVSTDSTFSTYITGGQDADMGNYLYAFASGLSANTTYYYRVRAYNGYGTSGNSGTIGVTTLPTPPSAPTTTAATSISSSGFTANWNSVSGATGYRLDISLDSAFGSFLSGYQDLDILNFLNRTVLGLTGNTTYYYRVRAYNAGGASGNSGTITVTTLPNAPTAPIATAATSVTSSGFTANWNSSSGATGYRIDVSTSSTFGTYISGGQDVNIGNSLAAIVSGQSANTTYYYRVRAYNGSGTSGNSGTITVTTLPNPPSAPTANAASSVASSGFTANWNSASGATGYRLDVSTSSTFASFVSGYQDLDVGNVVNRSVSGLNGSTTYYYRVRTYNTGGTSGNSGTITTTTLPNPPSAPTANAATSMTVSGFTANWSSASGATGYRLDVSTSSAFGSYISGYQDLDVGNVVTKAVSGLSAGTTYYYRVRAYNTGGTSGNSGTISTITIPPAPTANAASGIATNAFTANWSSTSGATGYRLDVSTNSAFSNFVTGNQDLDVGNVILRSVTGLNTGTVYYYRVRAYNGSGTSTSSATITTATAGPAIAFTKQSKNLILSWPTNDSAFKLYYTTNPITMTWISNTVSPSIVAGRYTITNSMTNSFKLYRLKK